jgi:multisubunit Na+/H+ antiporter MnhE subunit
MSETTPGTVAFVLYVLLFGWIGFRRGLFRELSVLIVSIGGFFLLQQNQGLALDIVRQVLGIIFGVISIGAKLLASLRAGGAGGDSEPVYTLGPSEWLSEADQPTVSFLVWSGLLLLTYILTNKAISDSQSSSGLLAAIIGMGNGLFYIPTFAPRLIAFIPEVGVASVSTPGTGVQGFLRSVTDMMESNFDTIWEALGPQQPILAAIALTVLLVAVISTLRRGQN